mgnify:CR=1 FL=1
MKKLLLAASILFGVCHSLMADHPARISYSETADIVYKSSYVPSVATPGTPTVLLSSGILKLKGVFVDSPGVNSMLLMYDSTSAAITTVQSGSPLTSTFGWIEMPMTTSSGTVYTSTCSGCLSAWTMPSLRFHYIRLR